MKRHYLLLGLLFCSICAVWAQTPTVCIKSIDIQGNKKTKAAIILNEMTLGLGDSLALKDLMPKIERSEQLIMNTWLFAKAKVKIAKWQGADVHLLVVVKERWYIYPVPVFELADRNFNVWTQRFNADFRRTNIGLWGLWRNISGRNDLLKVVGQWGFTQKYELDYLLPPRIRQKTLGMQFNLLYSDNKEVAYNTVDNRLVFYSDYESRQRQYQRVRARASLLYASSIYADHRLDASFLYLRISDTLQQLNPDYFLEGRTQQRSFNLKYTYERDHRDIWAYPLRGYWTKIEIEKRGLGVFRDVNQLFFRAAFSYHLQASKRLTASVWAKGQASLISAQTPYYDQRALGYFEDFVRGYEYFLINGQHFVLIKSNLNFKALDVRIPLFRRMPVEYLRSLPIKLHLRTFFEFGYVWDRYYAANNPLTNTDLIGTGLGLDLVFYYYNVILQFDYSINKLGRHGFYFSYKFNF